MNPDEIICPRERSELTPCIAREGSLCLSGDLDNRACIGCGITPLAALEELAVRWPRAERRLATVGSGSGRASEIANDLPGLVLGYLEHVEHEVETPLEKV